MGNRFDQLPLEIMLELAAAYYTGNRWNRLWALLSQLGRVRCLEQLPIFSIRKLLPSFVLSQTVLSLTNFLEKINIDNTQ